MNISDKYKIIIEKNLVFVSTSSKKGKPHLIVCASVKIFNDKILITDNYMKITKKNILENNLISLCVGLEKTGFLYISGKVDYQTSGKNFDFVKNLKENKGLPCKGVLVICSRKITFGK